MLGDIRYAFRTFAKRPSFAVAAIATLALGIAVNTIAFSLLNSLALRPMPVRDAGRVVRIYPVDGDGPPRQPFSSRPRITVIGPIRARRPACFETLAAYIPADLTAGRSSLDRSVATPRATLGYVVSASYFDLTGVRPALGRVLQPQDESTGTRAAVLGHAFWQARFGAETAVIGSTLTLNGEPFTVVGVAAPGFAGTEPLVADVWIPLSALSIAVPGSPPLSNRDADGLLLVGRLSPGVSRARAAEAMSVVAARLATAFPGSERPASVTVTPGTFFTIDPGVEARYRRRHGGGRPGAPDRVRERGQSDAGPRRIAAARDGGAAGDRGGPGTHHQATDGRGADVESRGGRGGAAARGVDAPSPLPSRRRARAVSVDRGAQSRAGRPRVRLHPRPGNGRGASARAGAGTPGLVAGHRARPSRRRRPCGRPAARHAAAERPGDPAGGRLARPARRRGPAAARTAERPRTRSRLQHRGGRLCRLRPQGRGLHAGARGGVQRGARGARTHHVRDRFGGVHVARAAARRCPSPRSAAARSAGGRGGHDDCVNGLTRLLRDARDPPRRGARFRRGRSPRRHAVGRHRRGPRAAILAGGVCTGKNPRGAGLGGAADGDRGRPRRIERRHLARQRDVGIRARAGVDRSARCAPDRAHGRRRGGGLACAERDRGVARLGSAVRSDGAPINCCGCGSCRRASPPARPPRSR